MVIIGSLGLRGGLCIVSFVPLPSPNASAGKISVRRFKKRIITTKDWISIVVYASLLAIPIVFTTWYCSYYLKYTVEVCNNITFFSLLLSQLWHVFNLPSRKISFFKNDVTHNKYVWGALVLCLIIIFGFYCISPLSKIVGITTLNGTVWLIIISISLVPVILIQLLKRGVKIID